jgi:hypothetical protein
VDGILDLPPGDIVDVEVSPGGTIYLLRTGLPHLVAIEPDGSEEETDLERIRVPGGMCLVDDWGFFVSDALSGTIVRFSDSGEFLEEFPAPGRPGDLVRDGLDLWYVSREQGTVRSVGEPGVVVFTLPGAGEGTLGVSEGSFLYSTPAGAWSFGTGEPAVPVPAGAPAAISRRGIVVLDRDSGLLTTAAGDSLAHIPSAGYDRISSSPEGGTIVLWSRSESSALVIR